jgi:hypothetical protein
MMLSHRLSLGKLLTTWTVQAITTAKANMNDGLPMWIKALKLPLTIVNLPDFSVIAH